MEAACTCMFVASDISMAHNQHAFPPEPIKGEVKRECRGRWAGVNAG